MGEASITKLIKNNGGTLGEETTLVTSAGAADAGKVPALNDAGVLDLSIVNGKSASAGVADAGKLVALDAAGLIDSTMMPGNSVAAETNPATGGLGFRVGESLAEIGTIVSATALTVSVSAFALNGFLFDGGAVTLPAEGVWYVGVDLLSKVLIALPRLGHRGWIPVAKAVNDATHISDLIAIVPAMPSCRIPRTIKKLKDGKPVSVVVMGSSLTQGGNATDWPGMLLRSDADLSKYRVPGVITATYAGVGGAPNQYQLAMLGLASGHTAYGYPSSGFPLTIYPKTPPNGRSNLFSGVDLVILGCLANGGDYRLECIEPIIRKLRSAGVEVIVTTDNPQGPSATYATMANASLYVDGPEVMRIADLYGVELVDTAAYVFAAHLRYGSGIYGDTIHMSGAVPAGRTAPVSCGHEVWARAIRSVITVDAAPGAPVTATYDFSSGVQGWSKYGSGGSMVVSDGKLVTSVNGDQQGSWVTINEPVAVGDTVTIHYDLSRTGTLPAGVVFGLQNAGWASNTVNAVDGTGQVAVLTCNKASGNATVIAYGGNSSANGSYALDNITISIQHASGVVTEIAPERSAVSPPLPPIRVVSDYKTPADAFVILPSDEYFTTSNNPNKGTLAPHPWGASSFARRWSGQIGSSADLLTLGAGKRAVIGAHGVVGWSLIRYQDQNDVPCSFDIYRNDGFVKTVAIGTAPFGNEWYTTLFSPTEKNLTTATDSGDSIEIRVTSGTLKVAAFIALTADIEYLFPEQITFVGNWLPKESSRSGLPGRPTDTVGDFAVVKCTGRRLQWLISGNPGSKQWTAKSDREMLANQNTGGNYHVYPVAGLLGPGQNHTIQCNEANASGSQANGHALHVGGAIVINDR